MEQRKKCCKCQIEKDFSEFTADKRRKDGKNFYCRSCQSSISRETYLRNRDTINQRQREYHTRNKDKNNARARKYYEKNKGEMREASRNWVKNNPDAVKNIRLKHKYGISLGDFNFRMKSQAGNCGLCGQKMNPPYVDHCHSTGAVRRLLCGNCNWGLGQFRDSPALLRKAAEYIESFSDKVQSPDILPFVGMSGL